MPGDVVELMSLRVLRVRDKHLSGTTQTTAAFALGYVGWTRGLPETPVKIQYSMMLKWKTKNVMGLKSVSRYLNIG